MCDAVIIVIILYLPFIGSCQLEFLLQVPSLRVRLLFYNYNCRLRAAVDDSKTTIQLSVTSVCDVSPEFVGIIMETQTNFQYLI